MLFTKGSSLKGHSHKTRSLAKAWADEQCLGHRAMAVFQRGGSAVLDVSEGGNRPGRSQAVTPSRENASITPGTTSDNYFQFAAATVKCGGEGPEKPRGQVQSVEKTRLQLSQVAQCGRVMSINFVFDGW